MLTLLTGLFLLRPARAQNAPPTQTPPPAAQTPAPTIAPAQEPPPTTPTQTPAPSAPDNSGLTPPPSPYLGFHAEKYSRVDPNGDVVASGNVLVEFAAATITANRVEGNINREIVFSGNAKIVARGVTSVADAIHVFPRTRSYRLDNPRGIISPDVLQERVLDPIFINGGQFSGTRTGYSLAEQFDATTCIEPHPHYELRVRSAELFPHKKLILRHVGVVFFGQKLIVLPYLVIPLDQRPRRARTDYLPEFGHNLQEGYYARFPYTFAEGLIGATFLRLDLTEKRGPGYRFEQEYLAGRQDNQYSTSGYGYGGGIGGGFTGADNGGAFNSAYGYGTLNSRLPRLGTGLGPQSGGLFAMQGYFGDGFDRNFNASFRHQQGIGSNNSIGLVTELQRNSFYAFTSQTNQNTRLLFDHTDPAHGVNAETSLSLTTNDSQGFSTSQLAASYRQSFEFASYGSNRNNLSYHFDLSRFLSDNATGGSQRTARLDSDFQFQHVSRDYSFSALANASAPIGTQTSGSVFGTLERLPELQFSADTVNFQGGWLHRVPLHIDLGMGRFSEPSSNLLTERALMGLTLQDVPILRGRTEMTFGGGFEQRLYGDGAAQYIVRNDTHLRQHLFGRSGFDLNYQYQQPEGGTPFLLDTLSALHYVTAEGGYLDDSHFQLTARVGYDFLGASSQRPWQSLSTRLMWRPTPSVRLDSLATYDPNASRFFAFTNALRLRGPGDFALDLIARYDPQQGRFSQVNTQFAIPLGRTWRAAGLLRYNGFTGKLESTNFQITHEWDCLEASLTYSDNPFSFTRDQQFTFMLRIKALPFSRSFGRGPAGEALGVSLGDIY